ncbi:MAG: zinc-ribbon domain-containing protein [Capsulimonadales bacterium]|nr:zinc-ribbon domain-containing protein [Capsulimonadales bacterium]
MAEALKPASETICNSCGKTNPAGMRFCGHCGAPIAAPSPGRPSAPVSATPSPDPTEASPVAPVSPLPPKNAPVLSPKTAPPPGVAPGGAQRPGVGGNAAERERERLVSQATALRIKGQITDARLLLQKALELADGTPPSAQAPLYEQTGDLLLIEELYDEAIAAYARARELDPKRVSAERKYAEAALQQAQATGKLSINEALLRGDSVADLIASGELGGNRGKRNAGVAMLLSLIVPGFGQFYNGQIVKAFVLIGAFAISLLVLSLSPEKDNLFRDIAAIFAMQGGRASFALSPLTSFFALVCVGSWLYAIVDAPFNAGKSGDNGSGAAKVDKSGWEV